MRVLVGGIAAIAVAALPSAAAAEDFCVVNANVATHASCPATHTTEPSVQAALTAAAAGGSSDRIFIGPTTVPEDGGSYGGGANPVEVVGAGRAATTLKTHTGDLFALGAIDPGASVHDLTIDSSPAGTSNGPRGLQLRGGSATHVDVIQSSSTATGGRGVVFFAGGTFSSGVVTFPANKGGVAFDDVSVSGTGVITDASATADTGLDSDTAPGQTTTVKRTRFTVTGCYGLVVDGGGTLNADDVLVDLTAGCTDADGLAVFSVPSATLNANQVTVVGQPGLDQVGGYVNSTAGGGVETLNVRNSIIEGATHSLQRRATSAAMPGSVANLNTTNSNYAPVAPGDSVNSGTGSGSITETAHTNLDPAFVDPAAHNYHLRCASPLIDLGETSPLGAGESPFDLDGAPRIVDGNADAVAVRDLGAYELQSATTGCGGGGGAGGGGGGGGGGVTPQPLKPDTTITSGPNGFTSSAPRFTFVSSFSGSTFGCSFDSEPFESCTTPLVRYGLAYGKHTFRVRAISEFGQVDDTPAVREFTLGPEVREFSCSFEVPEVAPGSGFGKERCVIRGQCPPLSKCGIVYGSIGLEDVQRTQGLATLDVCGGGAPSSCPGSGPQYLSTSCEINTPVVFSPCPHKGTNYSIDLQPPVGKFAGWCEFLQTSQRQPSGRITCTVGLRIIPAKPFVLTGQIGTTPVMFVPGPGTIALRSSTALARTAARHPSPISPLRLRVKGPGFVAIPLKLSRQARATLLRKRKIRLPLKLQFTPTTGARIRRTQSVTLRTLPCPVPRITLEQVRKPGARKKHHTCKARL